MHIDAPYQAAPGGPDDVADLVAHDAAAGLPGFTAVPIDQQQGSLAWATRIMRDAPGDTQRVIREVSRVVLLSIATTVYHLGPQLTRDQLLGGMFDDFADALHGPGTADQVNAVMSWWESLTAEEQALTGVQLPHEPAGD